MDEPQVNISYLKGKLTYHSEQNGLKRYLIKTKVELRNEENCTQILSIGKPNNLPIKCVLLLGETGAGKTTVVNGVINYLYGVGYHDNYRLIVKEELVSTGPTTGVERMETESQTDYISMYILYHQQGMKYKCNFVVIDTPGLADTRGTQHQNNVMKHLEEFLTTDNSIDSLHCIGLVAKACTNRDFTFQKEILNEVIVLLGNNVPEITNLFATFAVEKPVVDQIVRNTGMNFIDMFDFDNGVLFAPHRLSDSVMEEYRFVLEYRWKKMQKQYGNFFTALMNAPTVSVQILKEKKLLQRSLKELKLHVEELARLLTAIETNKKKLIKYELQEARNRDWRQERRITRRNRLEVPEGFHAHNCPQCYQTCIFPCPPVKDDQNAGIIGGLAGVLGGSAAGAAATQATISSVAAATRAAASSSGVAASVGGWVTRVLGGSVAATEMVATAGIPGVLVGGMVGITIGAVAGAACGKMITQANSCNFSSGRGDVCGERGCLHSLSQHLTERERIVEQVNVKYEINDDLKELYDVAVSKKNDAMAKIVSGRQKVILKKRQATEDFVWIVIRTKTLTRISQGLQQVNPSELLDQVIAEVRLGHPEHIHHGIHVLNLLKKSIKMVNVSDGEDVSGNCDMVMKLMENIPHES
ncbi:hypothetical protein Pmani_032114 [Petrolisthes manimaculis]|uniref:SRP54-type proteins GTP-binding domain-containing protein n=1 Tax=Petrolisthes manimaculis TaxID=1843537 RepID=A0AAE1NTY0_9EUCA|nr:hypothetical protein Pmani_032114 [Petrolisthes manimaculis]